MNHFIVSFQVIIDSSQLEHSLIGSISSTNDYQPNKVKNTITEQYRKRFPKAKGMAVKIVESKPVSNEDYVAATPNFIKFI